MAVRISICVPAQSGGVLFRCSRAAPRYDRCQTHQRIGGTNMHNFSPPSRRNFLRVSAVSAGAVGLTLANLGQLEAGSAHDLNCILLFLVGGPSQLDTFDPKPAAPEHVRGPFRPIRTSVPGLDLCEHLPRTAAQAPSPGHRAVGASFGSPDSRDRPPVAPDWPAVPQRPGIPALRGSPVASKR